ncbi:MAG TPA: hypothetical protein VNX21_01635 [Candidatus Thermoplasmatota archaeon]|nr:hypothetical protein [Candidatus Thermoplasmatota archaeon]
MNVRVGVPERLRLVAGPVALAIAADFALDLLLAPARSALEFVVRAVLFLIGASFAFLVGRWLGTRSWPARGRRLTRKVLERMLRDRNKPLLALTDRPDRAPTRWRRVLEVVGFTAGVSIILTSVLPVLGFPPYAVRGLGGVFALLALWGSFALVPYWTAIRMGLRVVDPVSWTVTPVSRRYADRLRLSNGAILLIALGVFVNLAVRAGASQEGALVQGVSTVTTIVASVLVMAATAVAYYSTREHALVREMEAEAIAMGVRDARGLTDGEFLPRVPAAKRE